MVPCDLTAIQSRVQHDAYEEVHLRAQIKFPHRLDGLLQENREACSKLILLYFPLSDEIKYLFGMGIDNLQIYLVTTSIPPSCLSLSLCVWETPAVSSQQN